MTRSAETTAAQGVAADQQQLLPIASTKNTRRAALRLLRRSPLRLGLLVLVLLAASASTLALPAILGLMIDTVIDAGPNGGLDADAVTELLWAAGALVAAAAVGAGLGCLGTMMLVGIAENALAELREEVMVVALALPQADLERAGTGDVVSRVSTDVEVVKEAVSGVLPAFTSAAFTIVLTVTAMGVLDWRFAVAALLPLPIQLLTSRWFVRRSGPVYRAQRATEAERSQHLLETVDGAGTALALGIERQRTDLVEQSSIRAAGKSIEAMVLVTRFYNRLNAAELVGLSAVLAVGFFLVGSGASTIGAATAAALYFHRLFDPIGVVLSEVDELAKAGAGLARLFGVTQLAGGTAVGATGFAPAGGGDSAAVTGKYSGTGTGTATGDGSVELRDVNYSYGDGRPALDGVSLTVRPGEHVALVGASGAGKSTVARLVAGILQPTSGSVVVGGMGTGDLGPTLATSRLALVSQEPWAFLGTLRDDLRLARPTADDETLWHALDLVGAGQWARLLPDGLATRIGAGGRRLTAGQVQQMALARVVLRDVPIVVLDEATAEAGTADAEILDAAAARTIKGRTAISVAHRLSQAAIADRIIVLDGGRIVEQGRHADLLDAGGSYAELWAAWAAHR